MIYQIKYEGSERVGIKRRVVDHNQIKRFHETNNRKMMNDDVDENDNGSTEKDAASIVVVDSPGVACPEDGESQENNNVKEEQPQQIEDMYNQINERRPQRERRPPDWFVDYQLCHNTIIINMVSNKFVGLLLHYLSL